MIFISWNDRKSKLITFCFSFIILLIKSSIRNQSKLLLLSFWPWSSSRKETKKEKEKLAVISKTASPRVNHLLKRYIFLLLFLLFKRGFTLGDAILEITASFSFSFFVSFLEELQGQKESRNNLDWFYEFYFVFWNA